MPSVTVRNCTFCGIVAGRLPTAVLFEDDKTVAFLDITAVTYGHTLVIPRNHSADIWEISEEDAMAVMRTARRMALRLFRAVAPEGLTLFQANRPAGWQDIFHFHVHLVPRVADDHLHRPWTAGPVGLAALEAIRAGLAIHTSDRKG
jgi:histidine triad (HIT) family protein